MKHIITFFIALVTMLMVYFFINSNTMSEEQKKPAAQPIVAEGHEQITLGAGCFWCVEAV